ncbi:M20/M25/M40 family metallo-hydrolase [Acidicapsa ligni]|uniref:M20/M25/M40 family metallo-hydrolase n=1 Tax=Acidicapsa ligni TaxID=542300 RepID=UPI0021E08433|nr:M20/M25/M40 family metallo-hydrolase [Acidicapsa ligni]
MTQALSVIDLLRELVAVSTPSSVSNLPLLHRVSAHLAPLGWHVMLFPYADEKGIEKANLIARPNGYRGQDKEQDKIDLAFICHTDTVPYAADWAGALHLEESEGMLHGCGSCDVKGALACFLAAVVGAKSDAIRSNVALILTADEEIGCKGMERLLGATNLRIGSALVSEPTSLRPGIAGKGYGLARIRVEGREAHSAFPQQGISAISIAARLIAKIEDSFIPSRHDRLFDPPHTTLNIGVIEGGTAKNIIPGQCSFLVEWRAIPGEETGAVFNRISALIEEVRQSPSSPEHAAIHIEQLRDESGFAPASVGTLQERLATLVAHEPVGISFGSEASRVARIADEVIVIGPGDMHTAHSARECVPIAELQQWTRVLRSLLTV